MSINTVRRNRRFIAAALLFTLATALSTGSFAQATGPKGCQAVSGPKGPESSCRFVSKTGNIAIVAAGQSWDVYAVGQFGFQMCAQGSFAEQAGLCAVGPGATVYLEVFIGVAAARDIPRT
jgi:hypothetical protein